MCRLKVVFERRDGTTGDWSPKAPENINKPQWFTSPIEAMEWYIENSDWILGPIGDDLGLTLIGLEFPT